MTGLKQAHRASPIPLSVYGLNLNGCSHSVAPPFEVPFGDTPFAYPPCPCHRSRNFAFPFARTRGGGICYLQPMNNWKIPAWLEREVIERDQSCVYCGISFTQVSNLRRERRSWEHIVNDATIVTRDNIALCCIGCNASKGAKTLEQWLASRYCSDRQISAQSVSPVVRAALAMRASNFTGPDPTSF